MYVQPNASAAPAAAFSDCENESVCLAAALGIVTGYDDGTFRPYRSITRQEAALIPYHTPTASRCAPF
ncbi:S-layer homology domain-containing protein [Butyricicoccus sp. AF24-19AC]|nr:S-layer homology domain-containing protein [Butyricicoccus sp. AF24-19AC]